MLTQVLGFAAPLITAQPTALEITKNLENLTNNATTVERTTTVEDLNLKGLESFEIKESKQILASGDDSTSEQFTAKKVLDTVGDSVAKGVNEGGNLAIGLFMKLLTPLMIFFTIGIALMVVMWLLKKFGVIGGGITGGIRGSK